MFFTDFLLLSLDGMSRGAIQMVTFDQNTEATNGADWEWWFVDQAGYSLPFRVQAKVLSTKGVRPASNPGFDKLHYAGSKSRAQRYSKGHQTKRLLRRAMVDHMLPTYCLYTHFDHGFAPPSSGCYLQSHRCEGYGLALIGANEVCKTKSSKLKALFDHVHGFECMFSHSKSLADIQDYFLARWHVTRTSKGPNYIRPPGKAPSYVRQGIGQVAAGSTGNQFLDGQFPPGTGRVTVFVFSGDALVPLQVEDEPALAARAEAASARSQ